MSTIKTKIAEYELIKKLSAGAFSEVWLGKNVQTQEQFAIKVINGTKNRGFTTNEVAAYRDLSHPNLIKAVDLHATNGEETVYVVMQWALDGDLKSKIPEQGLPEEEAREIFNQVLSAVKYMHSKGWIHRDIK
jgi:serine/threonine protein kinase